MTITARARRSSFTFQHATQPGASVLVSVLDQVPLVPATEACHCAPEAWDPEHDTLDIERDKPIAGVITRHYRHVLIHTGTTDWPKRIENDPDSVAAKLKALISGGMPSTADPNEHETATISLFPEALEVSAIPNSTEGLRPFVTSFLLHPSSDHHAPREADTPFAKFTIRKITKPVILTCSHGSRDIRCGTLGPAIINAFAEALAKQSSDDKIDAILGEISHIGGHKLAGNVIIHIPGEHKLAKIINEAPVAPSPLMFSSEDSEVKEEPVPGRSVAIWYGRVLPGHVEGILDTTIRNGKVVKELLRGIANSNERFTQTLPVLMNGNVTLNGIAYTRSRNILKDALPSSHLHKTQNTHREHLNGHITMDNQGAPGLTEAPMPFFYHVPGIFPEAEKEAPARKPARTRPKKSSRGSKTQAQNTKIADPMPSQTTTPDDSILEADTSTELTSPSSSLIESSATKRLQNGQGSDWYDPEVWPREKVVEQENLAAKLIGDPDSIKATLEYYCAHDLQYHTKWVRILADHILLLAESKNRDLNHAVAYQVSQQKASNYRQQLEASIIASESKRPRKEDSVPKGSLRGKRKIRRTDKASLSKGTHPLSVPVPVPVRTPLPKLLPKDDDDGNFKLIGPDDFIKTLQIPKKNEAVYLGHFRQLRDDIYQSLRNPKIPYDTLFFLRKIKSQNHGAKGEIPTASPSKIPTARPLKTPTAGSSKTLIASPSEILDVGPSQMPMMALDPVPEIPTCAQPEVDQVVACECDEMDVDETQALIPETYNENGRCAIQ
ncbi:LOW QUALITY PROTEIN: hypothetical protein Dda_5357 [Drechslerella dactyloides]|uniref:Altered inheritance of mitochondria protein 32 n=1 Tax=Drechslerella dactyloides TaxID=74499 RepID=A0AAD6NIM0_DREDA|nr:LOW QUALITY PROTEIN: hypothetical protein Dda_5357 [Drechslerella dactyloides]